jgi:alpha-mannosidase
MKILILLIYIKTLTCDNKLNIHIIPHTHTDVGWLFTADQYFYGNNDMNKCVKCILDNIIPLLENEPFRTYTFSEIAYFEKWYRLQNERVRLKIKQFIKENRLEFVNGGWVMNDEATPLYQDMIDNMRMGLAFLKEEFDIVPGAAWYIDSFGHSNTNV